MPVFLKKKSMATSRRAAHIGFVVVVVLAVLSPIVQVIRGFEVMDPAWTFNNGMDVFGTAICAIIYYSCLQSSESLDEYAIPYVSLLSSISIGLFLDECCWLVQGVAQLALLNKIANALFYANGIVIVCLFWEYVTNAISMDERLVSIVGRIMSVLFYPAILLCLANLFVPIYFSVDATGTYQREALFPLSVVFLLSVVPPLIVGLVTSKAPLKEKAVAGSFAVMPIAGEALSVLQFGISLQQAASVLSVVLIYGVLVADRTKKLAATNTELSMAAQIQASMMPQIFPPYPERDEFDIYATMEPAKGVGGDFYDFYLIDNDHLCIVMADVSGKGVPASLFMMASKIILQSCTMLGQSTADILIKTNEALCSKNEQNMFVTVWLGILEISTGKLTAANAGHEYPAIKRPDGPFEVIRDKHGLLIGVMDDVTYKDYEIQLEPGTKIFLYTDGVPEATDATGKMFGTERMVAALNEAANEPPVRVLESVHSAVDAFVGEAEQFDDITMLCLEYRGAVNE